MVNRGEIWQAQFGDVDYARLCVIISPNEMNQNLATVMVAPMTTRAQAAPFRVDVSLEGKTGLIVLDQIHTLDKLQLLAKKGALDGVVLTNVLNVLQEIFI